MASWDKPRSWEELEQRIGLVRTERPKPTQRDVANLTMQRLRGPFWRKRRR